MLATQAIAEDWKDALGLSARRAPEVYSDAAAVGDVPYARPIRTALRDLGADTVFCVQDVPTAVFFAADGADPADIAPLHSDLWNQGLASVLAVVWRDTIRIYSLAAHPPDWQPAQLDKDCLIEVLDKVASAGQVRSLLHGMESGRYWQEHGDRFDPKQRVDRTLLGNLTESERRLRRLGLAADAAQALLMQTMFISYLEDREIIGPDYIREAAGEPFSTFDDILRAGKPTAFYALFRHLNRHFNGDLFIKPCSFDRTGPRLRRDHLPVLADFRTGRTALGQYADQRLPFRTYKFELIPVELISAVYDQFLSAKDRAPKGQFHTPMHLAASVVSQLWDDTELLAKTVKGRGKFLDPACGSGIFLACTFKRLCEHWRDTKRAAKIRWPSLLALLDQLTGVDIDASAIRVAIFSLHIALLEEVTPPDIRKLMDRGRLLPALWGETLQHADFFRVGTVPLYDVVIGNPPWRKGSEDAAQWCEQNSLPAPRKEAAWGFVWKALRHLKKDGKLAYLLPAMPFLHTHSKSAADARSLLLRELRAHRIVTYSDMSRQLFAGAKHPAALFIGGRNISDPAYMFEFWAPKAVPGFSSTRLLAMGETDKCELNTVQVAKDPLLFKKQLWMTGPEDKLFHYLSSLSPLRTTVGQFKDMRKVTRTNTDWVIGQGFKPANKERVKEPSYHSEMSTMVGTLRFLPSGDFRVLSPSLSSLVGPRSALVHRKGFERGFEGPRILVTQGAGNDRLRAAYTETSFAFQHAIQAISVPDSERSRAKVLAAMLNSKLMFWFALHASSSIGNVQRKIHQDQLLQLPFPAPADVPEEHRAQSAAARLVTLMDEAKAELGKPLHAPNLMGDLLLQVDALVYDYFCLTEQEILLVEDTIKYTVPSIQPTSSSSVPIWQQTVEKDRRAYASVLTSSLTEWMEPDNGISVTLIARSRDLAVVRLRLCAADRVAYEEQQIKLGEVLSTVANAMDTPLPGNLHRLGNLRVYAGDDLYMVKPNRMRFWTRSAARVDAEQIVADLWH